jgi:hypothetical protein
MMTIIFILKFMLALVEQKVKIGQICLEGCILSGLIKKNTNMKL